jgi:hypothetical protein
MAAIRVAVQRLGVHPCSSPSGPARSDVSGIQTFVVKEA